MRAGTVWHCVACVLYRTHGGNKPMRGSALRSGLATANPHYQTDSLLTWRATPVKLSAALVKNCGSLKEQTSLVGLVEQRRPQLRCPAAAQVQRQGSSNRLARLAPPDRRTRNAHAERGKLPHRRQATPLADFGRSRRGGRRERIVPRSHPPPHCLVCRQGLLRFIGRGDRNGCRRAARVLSQRRAGTSTSR